MFTLNAITWDVDPTLFTLFGKEVRWYSLLFSLGLILIGPYIERLIWKREQLPDSWVEKLWWYIVISTLVGARLGHCLFYDPAHYRDYHCRVDLLA